MAVRFRLADIAQTAGTIVDLLDGTLKLVDRSWATRAPSAVGTYGHVPYGANPDFGYFDVVREQFDLIGDDTVAHLVDATEDIEEIFEKARLYHHDQMNAMSWWLEANADGEGPRRTLLYKGMLQFKNKIGISPLLECDKVIVRALIDRHPFWETVIPHPKSTTNKSWWGGTWQVTNIPGTAPARMQLFAIPGRAGAGSVENVWMGIRPEYEGFGNWSPIWECEDGGNYPADTTDVGDGSASSGNKVQVDFTTSTDLIKRMRIRVADVTAHPKEYLGRYLVLCRCKVSAGTIGVQMKYGRGITGKFSVTPNEEVYVTNTVWRLIPIGEVVIPPEGTLYDDQASVTRSALAAEGVEIQIWAERIDGAGTLDLDAFVLIPSDHFVSLYDTQAISVLQPCRIFTTEADRNTVYVEILAANMYESIANPDIRDWYLPTGNSMVVIAGDSAAGHNMTFSTDLTIQYNARWQTLRGS